jgi:hypothetical protein
MRTLQNYIKGLAVAGLTATLLVQAAPAAADQAVTIIENGSKKCIMLSGVLSNASEWVALIIGAVLEKLGC